MSRWEAAHIKEWIYYHQSIGFGHIYLYCNDDDPQDLYEECSCYINAPNPFITFVHFPFQGRQRDMYVHFLKTKLHETKNVMFLDVDEFLCIPGLDSIEKFVESIHQEWDAIYFNWMMFGTNGFEVRPKGSVLLQYTQHANNFHPYTKMLTKSASINVDRVANNKKHSFWHDWHSSFGDMKRVDVRGRDMGIYYTNFPMYATSIVQNEEFYRETKNRAFICHFNIKSIADLERRVSRGLGGDFGSQTLWGNLHKSGEYRRSGGQKNEVSFYYMRDYWIGIQAKALSFGVIPKSNYSNLSFAKPCLQSSVCQWSRQPTVNEDAGGAVNGRYTGHAQFHTNNDDEPWWQVDLQKESHIYEVRIFNRMDVAQERGRNFTIQLSGDGESWRVVYERTVEEDFGGVDGFPFRWCLDEPVVGRYVRIALKKREYLHLDQVEIFGVSS